MASSFLRKPIMLLVLLLSIFSVFLSVTSVFDASPTKSRKFVEQRAIEDELRKTLSGITNALINSTNKTAANVVSIASLYFSEMKMNNGNVVSNTTTRIPTTTQNNMNYAILSFTPPKKSLILAVVSEFMVSHIKTWYEQMSALGYEEHAIAAYDEPTLKYLQDEQLRHVSCIHVLPNRTQFKLPRQKYRRQVFAGRWHCVQEVLEQGYNVLLTDIDNVFTRHVPLEELEEFNVIHAYAGGYPVSTFQKFGYSVCGGMMWLQSAPPTLRFVDHIVQRCQYTCDDQVVINHLMVGPLNMTWNETQSLRQNISQRPAVLGQPYELEQQPQSQQHNWPEAKGSRVGYCPVTGHSVKIWDTSFAYRGPVNAKPCPDPQINWVTMPIWGRGVNRKKHTIQKYCPALFKAKNNHTTKTTE